MQVGDKVKCIDASLSNGILNLRKEYVITYVHFDGVRGCVDNTGDVLWHLDRFELIKEEDMQKKFNPKSEPAKFVPPKPGDKIICNNGEEFICCTLEELMQKYPEAVTKPYKTILSYKERGGCVTGWQSWFPNGNASYQFDDNDDTSYDIREVIPRDSFVDSKELLYTVEEVFEATQEVTVKLGYDTPWDYLDDVKEHLSRKSDKQYQEYLRLKAIYE